MTLKPSLSPSPKNGNAMPPHGKTVSGNGKVAHLVRAHDWGATSLGPIESWPETLLCSVNLMLASRFPTLVFWGLEMIQFYNDAYLPLMGEKSPAALGQTAQECWKEAWHIVGPQLEAVLTRGETTYQENVIVPVVRNGQLQDIYWTYSYSPIYKSGGDIAGIFVVCHDITVQVLAARNLRESEARATRILQSIGDAVIVTDAETCVARMNPVAETLTGWTIGEAEGQPLAEVFHIVNEATRQLVEGPADKVKRLGSVVGLANHTVLIRRDGTETPIDDSGAPIRNDDGELSGIVLVFRDINEKRAAERERDAIAERLQQVLEITTDSVLSIDRNWRITYMNPPALIAASPIKDAVGRDFWQSFPAAVYEGSPYVEHYYRAMNERVAGEFEAFYPDPLNIWVHVQARPARDGIVLFFRDVTEQKRAAAALMQSEKLAAVGRLAASIAHEINNPLESVTNLLYLARTSNDFEQVQEFLDTAERELRRVSVISNQTLRFHKQSSNPRLTNCEDLFEGVLSIYQGRLVNSRIEVLNRKRALQPVVCFDGEIRQVLNNLIGNAIDAMHPNGGRLLLRSREATDWSTGRKGLMLTIADTGEGISPHTLRKIFEPFFTTKGIGGTGLGLWISQEIIARHHGALRVRSSQSKGRSGTIFSFFLPFDAALR